MKNDSYEYAYIENLENLSNTINDFILSNQDIAIECIEKMIEILLELEDKTFYYDGIYRLLNEIEKNDRSSEYGTPLINKVFEKIVNKSNFIKYAYTNYIENYKDILELIIVAINTDKNSDMAKIFKDEIGDIELLSKINVDL